MKCSIEFNGIGKEIFELTGISQAIVVRSTTNEVVVNNDQDSLNLSIRQIPQITCGILKRIGRSLLYILGVLIAYIISLFVLESPTENYDEGIDDIDPYLISCNAKIKGNEPVSVNYVKAKYNHSTKSFELPHIQVIQNNSIVSDSTSIELNYKAIRQHYAASLGCNVFRSLVVIAIMLLIMMSKVLAVKVIAIICIAGACIVAMITGIRAYLHYKKFVNRHNAIINKQN